MKKSRENPDSEENQRLSKQNEREVFALQMQHKQDFERQEEAGSKTPRTDAVVQHWQATPAFVKPQWVNADFVRNLEIESDGWRELALTAVSYANHLRRCTVVCYPYESEPCDCGYAELIADVTKPTGLTRCGSCSAPLVSGQTWCDKCGSNDDDE